MHKLFVTFVGMTLFLSPVVSFADGKMDYNAKCAACHALKAKSLPKTARQFKIDPRKSDLTESKISREEMVTIIEKGKDKMPGFEKELSKQQIEAIIDYVLMLK
jgi:mono/diheme cytochrome c family protein